MTTGLVKVYTTYSDIMQLSFASRMYSLVSRDFHNKQRVFPSTKLKGSIQNGDGVLENNQFDAQFFFLYVYFNCLHISSNPVLIIRRFNCSKHVENWNKHIEKGIVRQVGCLQKLYQDARSIKQNSTMEIVFT